MERMRPEEDEADGNITPEWMDNKKKLNLNTTCQKVIDKLASTAAEKNRKKEVPFVLKPSNEKEALKSRSWFKGDSHLCWSSSDTSALKLDKSGGFKTLNDLTWNFGGSGVGSPGQTSDGGGNGKGKTSPTKLERRGFFAGRPVTPTVLHSAGRKTPHVNDRLFGATTPDAGSSDEEIRGNSRPKTAPQVRTRVVASSTKSSNQEEEQLVTSTQQLILEAKQEKSATILTPFSTETFKDFEKITPKSTLGLLERQNDHRRPASATVNRVRVRTSPTKGASALFTSQQLSDRKCWSPKMTKQMSNIFSPPKATVGLGSASPQQALPRSPSRSPTKMGAGNRPRTSPGHRASPGFPKLKSPGGSVVSGSDMDSIGDNSSTFGPFTKQ